MLRLLFFLSLRLHNFQFINSNAFGMVLIALTGFFNVTCSTTYHPSFNGLQLSGRITRFGISLFRPPTGVLRFGDNFVPSSF